jgi:hypothetical protein
VCSSRPELTRAAQRGAVKQATGPVSPAARPNFSARIGKFHGARAISAAISRKTLWRTDERGGLVREDEVAGVRGVPVILSPLLILLSACASVSGTNGAIPGINSASYHHGYDSGREARNRYGTRPDSSPQDLMAFCVETAYLDIQPMKGELVLWSEGFDAGCLND